MDGEGQRALQIPELVELICSQIVPKLSPARQSLSWSTGKTGNRDLAALARTSRIFQEPALNALWRSQSTFANVLRCMPGDLWATPIVDGLLDSLVGSGQS